LTTWSPLASGLLTGKYLNGIPEGSRATLPGYEWLKSTLTDEAKNAKVREMQQIANDLGITLSQLAIAWCVKNKHVSTVITGASTPEQVVENMSAMDAVPLLTKDICDKLDIITLF
jgi:aryl-alcohol dehydrogenase-like predicted oxidoreductase